MKHVSRVLGAVTMACLLAVTNAAAEVAVKIAGEAIQEALEKAAAKSGRELGEEAAQKSMTETLERLSTVYGEGALEAVRDGGLELLESVPQYGDNLIAVALETTPAGRRALAMDLPNLLPLAKRAGAEALELEARTPGLAVKVYETFGDAAGKLIAKNTPTEDVPRLLSYAEKADTPATKTLLLETYQKEGKNLFERIPAKLVLATGLSAAMLVAANGITDPAKALGDAIRNDKDIAGQAVTAYGQGMRVAIFSGLALACCVVIVVLWRFRLMPWHGKKPAAPKPEETSGG